MSIKSSNLNPRDCSSNLGGSGSGRGGGPADHLGSVLAFPALTVIVRFRRIRNVLFWGWRYITLNTYEIIEIEMKDI